VVLSAIINVQIKRRKTLTSVKPRPPAATQSDPVRTGGQFKQPDVRVYVEERGQVTALPQTLVPCAVPCQKLVAIEDETRLAVVEFTRGISASLRSHYIQTNDFDQT